jgi:hypothetical protein
MQTDGRTPSHGQGYLYDTTARTETFWFVPRCFHRGDITYCDLPGCDAVEICIQAEQISAISNPECHKTAALRRGLPARSVRVLAAGLTMFCLVSPPL